jgi:hypothetical protein
MIMPNSAASELPLSLGHVDATRHLHAGDGYTLQLTNRDGDQVAGGGRKFLEIEGLGSRATRFPLDGCIAHRFLLGGYGDGKLERNLVDGFVPARERLTRIHRFHLGEQVSIPFVHDAIQPNRLGVVRLGKGNRQRVRARREFGGTGGALGPAVTGGFHRHGYRARRPAQLHFVEGHFLGMKQELAGGAFHAQLDGDRPSVRLLIGVQIQYDRLEGRRNVGVQARFIGLGENGRREDDECHQQTGPGRQKAYLGTHEFSLNGQDGTRVTGERNTNTTGGNTASAWMGLQGVFT